MVLSGNEEELRHSGWTFTTVKRTPLKAQRDAGRYVVKSILSRADETLDLTEKERELALRRTNEQRQKAGEEPDNIPSGPEIRRIRGDDPRRGLLLIYPLSPAKAKADLPFPIFGIVVSFPDSSSGRAVRYRFNTVEQRMEPA